MKISYLLFLALLLCCFGSSMSFAVDDPCLLSAQQREAIAFIPSRLTSCPYHPNINDQPYVGSCVDGIVDIGSPILESIFLKNTAIADTLRSAKRCPYHPNVNDLPYVASCINQVAQDVQAMLVREFKDCKN